MNRKLIQGENCEAVGPARVGKRLPGRAGVYSLLWQWLGLARVVKHAGGLPLKSIRYNSSKTFIRLN